jgi:multicomponent Na+:H+ antiporter subunit C
MIETHALFAVAGVLVFCIGMYGLVAREHLLRKVIGFNVMGAGVFLFLVSIARRNADPFPDPVPHAMVITGIVVALAASAFAVAVARRLYAETGRKTLGENGDAT